MKQLIVESIIKSIKEIEKISLSKVNDGGSFYNISLAIKGVSLNLHMLLPAKFPMLLPEFFIKNQNEIVQIPHVEPSGKVCYIEREGTFINTDYPEKVLMGAVYQLIETLKAGISGENQSDFIKEFTSYWIRHKNIISKPVISYLSKFDSTKEIRVYINNDKFLVCQNNLSQTSILKNFKSINRVRNEEAIYVNLSIKKDMKPPIHDNSYSGKEFYSWLTKSFDFNFLELEQKKTKPSIYILGFEYDGKTQVFGVRVRSSRRNNFFYEKGEGYKVSFLSVIRYDKKTILPRGGGDLQLQNKKIIVIGCGSVGADIVTTLAKLGVGQLHLVDGDKITISNIHRFELGRSFIGEYKVKALKKYLDNELIYTKTHAYIDYFEKAIKNFEYENFDLIISATGDPSINFEINRISSEKGIASIYAWNEPLGIGGHALISTPDYKGCYKCLFNEEGKNKSSFCDSEQEKPFYKQHLGCGEVYTVFTILDSKKTSVLACQLAVDYLLENDKSSKIRSWKGNDLNFVKEGFKSSKRYQVQSQDELDNNQSNFYSEECKVCSNDC